MINPLYQATIPMGGSDTSYNAPKVLGVRIHADQSFDLQYTLTKGDGTTAYDIDGATSQLYVTAYKGSGYTPVLLVSGVHSDSGHGGAFDDVTTFTVPSDAIPEDIANFPLRNPGNAVFYAIITDSAGKLIEIVAEVNIFDTDYSLTGEAAPSDRVIIPKANDLGTVENLTTTVPPTPTLNIAYIVGPSATGDWSGQDDDLAIGTGTAWVFLTPVEGNFVYDKATDTQYVFDTSWLAAGGAPFSDASALIKNDSDNTKLQGFDLSGITTGTERTATMPDQDLNLTPGTGSFEQKLSGATLSSATVAATDKIIGQDTDDSDNLKTFTAQSIADLAAAGVGVYRNIYIDAAAQVPRTTNGAEALTKEFATNDIMIDYLAFDSTTEEGAQFKMMIPDEWDLSTIKFKFFWDAAATASGTVVWGVRAGALSNDDAIDAALGTEVTVTDTLLAVGDMHISPATAAVTVGGTPALADMIIFQVVAKTSGTIAVDQFLMGVAIQYKELTTPPVIW